MATVILTVAGTILGGPIGAAVGAAVGQQVDRRLLAPKGRSGPRLSDLAVQSSSYGAPLPRLFGTTRVSGSVIWSTDLIESRQKVKTGKGQPKQTVYSYAASFAVALSARPIQGVGRIWADGKLLRGAAGDFKVATGFRVHTGHDGQAPDPLIASAEGVGQTPAYRGLAYAVFDGMQLAEFGNRIPSLSFEVIADAAPVSLGAMVEELAAGALAADCPTLLRGYAVTGGTPRALLASISPALPIFVARNGVQPVVRETGMPAQFLNGADFGAHRAGGRAVRLSTERRADHGLPGRVALAHFDPERDYQPGLQHAWRDAGEAEGLALELAAVLTATEAQALAARALAEQWVARETIRLQLPWRHLALRPGQTLNLPGVHGLWRVRAHTLEAMIVTLELVRLAPGSGTAIAASSGRPVLEADEEHGSTRLRLLDLPYLAEGLTAEPMVLVAANGALPGWRRAALSLSVDGGVSWADAGFTAAPAVAGHALSLLSPGVTDRMDWVNHVDVALDNPLDDLVSTGAAALLSGANLAALGDELIQFQSATPIAGGWRLSGLLRGRRGTEWGMTTHQPGEALTLIESESLAVVAVPPGVDDVRIMAIGIGDEIPAQAMITLNHAALRPPAPVHFRAMPGVGGGWTLCWTRRSRVGWAWPDHVDAPLAEEAELYQIDVMPSIGPARTHSSSAPAFNYDAAMQAADLAAGAHSVSFSIRQIGTWGASRPLVAALPIT